MHVPKEQRSKFDDKATPCFFIGYGDEEFGYRLWDSEKQNIVKSRDMLHEHNTIEDMEKNVRGAKLTYEGIIDLTLGKTSSESGDDNDTRGVDQGEQIPPLEEGPQLRWAFRERRPSTRYPSSEYILFEAQSHKDKDCWIKSMKEEMNYLWKIIPTS